MSMNQNTCKVLVPLAKNRESRRCLSCGTRQNLGKKRYCSISCRQNLRQRLDVRTGLLQALNTRYATFSFTEHQIILDIIPYGAKEVCTFLSARATGNNPGEDFSRLAETLGKLWWAEHQRTKKRYHASRHVLDYGLRNLVSPDSVRPVTVYTPAVKPDSLACLNVEKRSLNLTENRKIIKDAYRRQAKIHHPDAGGDAAIFRKVHKAYEELIHWTEHPSFTHQRGFPDKWVYEGERNRWLMPAPLHTRSQ